MLMSTCIGSFSTRGGRTTASWSKRTEQILVSRWMLSRIAIAAALYNYPHESWPLRPPQSYKRMDCAQTGLFRTAEISTLKISHNERMIAANFQVLVKRMRRQLSAREQMLGVGRLVSRNEIWGSMNEMKQVSHWHILIDYGNNAVGNVDLIYWTQCFLSSPDLVGRHNYR